MGQSNNTYQAKVECLNCRFKGTLVIEKGQKVDNTKCPVCDTDELITQTVI